MKTIIHAETTLLALIDTMDIFVLATKDTRRMWMVIVKVRQLVFLLDFTHYENTLYLFRLFFENKNYS